MFEIIISPSVFFRCSLTNSWESVLTADPWHWFQQFVFPWSALISPRGCRNFHNFCPLEVTVTSWSQSQALVCLEKWTSSCYPSVLAMFTSLCLESILIYSIKNWNKEPKQSSNVNYVSDHVKIIQIVLRKFIRDHFSSNLNLKHFVLKSTF